MIETFDLTREIEQRVIVDAVSFTAPNGQITGLLGPNGAGKTTTLRMITGLARPDRGRSHIDGIDAVRQPLAARSRLGVLADDAGLYPRLTVREHLVYSAGLQGLCGTKAADAVHRAASLAAIEGVLDQRTAGFSRGERQKVALARALVHDPMNLLLDEPTHGLDVAASRALRATLRALADQGRCVVISSHVMQDIAALCEHVVVMKAGKVITQGSPAALQRVTAANTFEDAFLRVLGDGEGLQ